MATTDLVNDDAPSSPVSEDPLPMSTHSEDDGGIGGEPLQYPSNGATVTPQSDPNRTTVHKFFKGKENVGKALSERSGKLTLLELPLDILRLIVQEVRIPPL